MKLIAPSILSADFSILGDEIRAVDKAGADWIHIDVMDGHFVPNITIGPLVVDAVRKITDLTLDVHLMIENPEKYIQAFVDAGADLITVQVETCVHLNRVIQMIHQADIKAGAVLNPSTPLSSIEWEIDNLDLVMLMGVNPGFGGQKFIPATLDKVRVLRSVIQEKGLETLIEMDGGVSKNTIKEISDSGVDVLVSGSAIFGTENYAETIESFRKLIG
ncbi:MAG: ribulose-phosphate 3-epimerase [Thermodesulfobacteriota bacterium]